jgi:hypothetical protein
MLNNLLILVATLLLIVQSAPLQIRQDIYRNTNCAGEKTGPLRTVTILLNTCFPGSRASQVRSLLFFFFCLKQTFFALQICYFFFDGWLKTLSN